MDLSKLKKHRGAKDAQGLEEVVSGYRKQMQELQGQINQMTPNMRVNFSFLSLSATQVNDAAHASSLYLLEAARESLFACHPLWCAVELGIPFAGKFEEVASSVSWLQ